MPDAYYDSELTSKQIEDALTAINGVVNPSNNGKVLYVDSGQIKAASASQWGRGAVLEPLSVTANGDYTPPTGVDGFDSVHVTVNDYPNAENMTFPNTETTVAKCIALTTTFSNIAEAIISKSGQENQMTPEQMASAISKLPATKVYGFYINGNNTDPAAAVTYLGDAVGKTPAHMDFENDRFDWGGWSPNEFFMPRPCMLKYDGTVDYYLDPNDYTKKLDGTPSDIADDTYGGNAMMEWGRDGKRIWYKIVPDKNDPTSASVYVADAQVDNGYVAWSFVNSYGVMTEHFYTPIYSGTIDSEGRLRSISGKSKDSLCQSLTVAQEIAAAELNNPGTDRLWYTEVFCDVTLIGLLLILMAKTRDTQTAYGLGRCGQASTNAMLGTGTMDSKGLFWGSSSNNYGVKVFGMENLYGNQWRRTGGYITRDGVHRYKMTRGRQDGSSADDFNTTGDGYLIGTTAPMSEGFTESMHFDKNCFQTATVGGDSAHNWCDYWISSEGSRYAARGGACANIAGWPGAFCFNLNNAPSATFRSFGAALSCKPLV